MNQINVYSCSKNPIFNEFLRAFELSMHHYGIQTVLKSNNQLPDTDTVFVLVGSQKDIPNIINIIKNTKFKILIQFEQLSNISNENTIKIINSTFDYILTIFKSNERYINQQKFIYSPIGYSFIYETESPIICSTPKINCLHFGGLTPLRRKFISKYKRHITMYTGYGINRDIQIINSKTILMLKAYPFYCLPPLKYLLIACKKQLAFVQPHNYYDLFIPNKHFVEFQNFERDLIYWCNNNNDKRIKFTHDIYEDLKTNYNYTTLLQQPLEKLGLI